MEKIESWSCGKPHLHLLEAEAQACIDAGATKNSYIIEAVRARACGWIVGYSDPWMLAVKEGTTEGKATKLPSRIDQQLEVVLKFLELLT